MGLSESECDTLWRPAQGLGLCSRPASSVMCTHSCCRDSRRARRRTEADRQRREFNRFDDDVGRERLDLGPTPTLAPAGYASFTNCFTLGLRTAARPSHCSLKISDKRLEKKMFS